VILKSAFFDALSSGDTPHLDFLRMEEPANGFLNG